VDSGEGLSTTERSDTNQPGRCRLRHAAQGKHLPGERRRHPPQIEQRIGTLHQHAGADDQRQAPAHHRRRMDLVSRLQRLGETQAPVATALLGQQRRLEGLRAGKVRRYREVLPVAGAVQGLDAMALSMAAARSWSSGSVRLEKLSTTLP